jgi:hypothetical protein
MDSALESLKGDNPLSINVLYRKVLVGPDYLERLAHPRPYLVCSFLSGIP